MSKFNLNLTEELGIMEKYNLCPNEVFLIRILLLAKDENNSDYLVRYAQLDARKSIRETLIELQNKSIILKSYKIPPKGTPFDPNTVEFNQNVLKTFYKASFDMGIELFETYPMFTTINGCTVSLRGISKKFDSLEDFYKFYGKSIKWNPEIHANIINLLNWAKENTQFINMSLANFVIEQKWNELQVLKDNNMGSYDNVKLI